MQNGSIFFLLSLISGKNTPFPALLGLEILFNFSAALTSLKTLFLFSFGLLSFHKLYFKGELAFRKIFLKTQIAVVIMNINRKLIGTIVLVCLHRTWCNPIIFCNGCLSQVLSFQYCQIELYFSALLYCLSTHSH